MVFHHVVCVHAFHAGCLLSASPIARVHRVTGLVLELTVLASKSAPSDGCPLSTWLQFALNAFVGSALSEHEVGIVMKQWCPVLEEVWAKGLEAVGRGGVLASHGGRQMKRIVREFAEVQQKKLFVGIHG